MIPDFKTYIGESTLWGDIIRQGSGLKTKIEDDINLLDGPDLKDYITSHYKPLNAYAIVTYSVLGTLSVPIVSDHVNYSLLYHKDSFITINYDLFNIVDGLLEKLKTNFSIEEHKSLTTIYSIVPKDGSKVTNKFFIEVIDFILDNIHDSNDYKKAIKKINKKS